VEIYTIGFTQKSAREFFGALSAAGIRRLIDVRLNNSSQLAGFTKKDDLIFFLDRICGAEYLHEPQLAPSPKSWTDSKEENLVGRVRTAVPRTTETATDRKNA
jgi:uncharacterized protein (DUF488 family)